MTNQTHPECGVSLCVKLQGTHQLGAGRALPLKTWWPSETVSIQIGNLAANSFEGRNVAGRLRALDLLASWCPPGRDFLSSLVPPSWRNPSVLMSNSWRRARRMLCVRHLDQSNPQIYHTHSHTHSHTLTPTPPVCFHPLPRPSIFLLVHTPFPAPHSQSRGSPDRTWQLWGGCNAVRSADPSHDVRTCLRWQRPDHCADCGVNQPHANTAPTHRYQVHCIIHT